MWFESRITDADLDRVTQVEVTALLTAGAETALLEAIDIFAQEYVIPVLANRQTVDRDKAFVGLFYRSLGFVKSAAALKDVVHQQTITSAERSVLELYVDMELLHRNAIQDGVTKILTFGDWQKLKAARRVDRLYTKYQDLDQAEANPHRNFINTQAQLIEQKAMILWGLVRAGITVVRPHTRRAWIAGSPTVGTDSSAQVLRPDPQADPRVLPAAPASSRGREGSNWREAQRSRARQRHCLA